MSKMRTISRTMTTTTTFETRVMSALQVCMRRAEAESIDWVDEEVGCFPDTPEMALVYLADLLGVKDPMLALLFPERIEDVLAGNTKGMY